MTDRYIDPFTNSAWRHLGLKLTSSTPHTSMHKRTSHCAVNNIPILWISSLKNCTRSLELWRTIVHLIMYRRFSSGWDAVVWTWKWWAGILPLPVSFLTWQLSGGSGLLPENNVHCYFTNNRSKRYQVIVRNLLRHKSGRGIFCKM